MSPFLSTEIRWFFPAPEQDLAHWESWLRTWAGKEWREQQERTDFYYRLPHSDHFGIKWRGEGPHGKLETKERTQLDGMVHYHDALAGEVQHWIKWSLPLAPFPVLQGAEEALFKSHWIAVKKRRRVALLEVGEDQSVRLAPPDCHLAQGVQVELSEVFVADQYWLTIGLEAFGLPSRLRSTLDAAAYWLCATLSSRHLPPTHSCSYYQWLDRFC